MDAAASRISRCLVLRAVLLRRRLLRRRLLRRHRRENVFHHRIRSRLGPVLRAQCSAAQRRPAESRGRGSVSDIALSRSPSLFRDCVAGKLSPIAKTLLILRGHRIGSARAGRGEREHLRRAQRGRLLLLWRDPTGAVVFPLCWNLFKIRGKFIASVTGSQCKTFDAATVAALCTAVL